LDGGNTVSPLRNNNLTGTVSSILDGVIVQNGINPASDNGGGMILASGAVVRNCIFRHNQTQNSKNGAALHCNLGTITIENSLFVNNTSSGNGGAIQIGGGTTCIMINCTLANNKATGLGGAIGTGTASSNCTLINTIAYNNQSSSSGTAAYESYAQNADINSGGTIVSKNSAIESTSTKFTAGSDHVSHIVLTRENTPGFVAASELIGRQTDGSDVAAANAASYALADGSECIDAGTSDGATDILYDLAHENRVQGESIDMGAYEFQSSIPPTSIASTGSSGNIAAFVTENELHVSGAGKGKQLSLFNISGALVYSQTISAKNTVIRLQEHGFYLVKIEESVVKIKY
jgi:hypothetical protein